MTFKLQKIFVPSSRNPQLKSEQTRSRSKSLDLFTKNKDYVDTTDLILIEPPNLRKPYYIQNWVESYIKTVDTHSKIRN